MAVALKRSSPGVLPVVGIFVLLLLSLWVMSDMAQNSMRFERFYFWLLLANAVALVVLAAIIVVNLIETVSRAWRGEPGSRLTLRMTVLFIVLSLAPVSVVYYFSITFLHRGIDSWFDVRVEKALEDALELSRNALDLRVRQVLEDAARIAQVMRETPDGIVPFALGDALDDSPATELTLFGINNRIIAIGSQDAGSIIPPLPTDEMNLRLSQGQVWHAVTPTRDDGLDIRIAVPIPATPLRPEPRVLQAIYPVDPRLSQLAVSVQQAFADYKEFAFLRAPLKQSFTITLSLALALSVLAAVWAAFRSSRRLLAPIHELAAGTRAVAEGHYHTRLQEGGDDDLGILLRSFNEMTAALAAARDEAERSRQVAAARSAFVEAVVQHLSSGVITLDAGGILRTANRAASAILEADLAALVDHPLAETAAGAGPLERFHEEIAPCLARGDRECAIQITVFGNAGRKVLIVRGARLPDLDDLRGGFVLVFDDVTTLIQAQRDAAWGEVARRLAHEIKNPLTPIQLSAERLAHKLKPCLDEEGSQLLARSTRTIIQQVEALKSMVNAFSEYARAPVIRLEPLDVNQLARDVVELYRAAAGEARFVMDLDDQVARIEADSGRLRQLLHNLIKNAVEATEGIENASVEVRTRCLREGGSCRSIELAVCDNGPGLMPEVSERLFEPYVTTKPKGTGLGLAVVRKIVEEHGGIIRAENRPEGGACLTIQLPATSTEKAA